MTLKIKGYTLIELMVALTAGSILLSGVAMSYAAIKSTIQTTSDIEVAQEVIRYSNQVLTRSIKQTIAPPQVDGAGLKLTLQQAANTISCTGQTQANAYSEIYEKEGEFLVCTIGTVKTKLVKGVGALSFSYNNLLTTVTITPVNAIAPITNGLQIHIAASQLVLVQAYGA